MLTGPEIAATIDATKNVRDLIAGMMESSEKRKLAAAVEHVQDEVIALQGKIIEANQSLMSANERAREAEQKCMELEHWQVESARYVLTEIRPGFPAYGIRPGLEVGEPLHYLCPACFGRHQKGFLQIEDRGQLGMQLGDLLKCGCCSFQAHVPHIRRQ